jgi:hypothetical protein
MHRPSNAIVFMNRGTKTASAHLERYFPLKAYARPTRLLSRPNAIIAAVLKEVTVAAMTMIKADGIAGQQPAHDRRNGCGARAQLGGVDGPAGHTHGISFPYPAAIFRVDRCNFLDGRHL